MRSRRGPGGVPRSGPFGLFLTGDGLTHRAGALRQVVCVHVQFTYRVILHRGAEHQSKRRETLAYTSTRTHATGPTGVRTIDFGLMIDRRHRGPRRGDTPMDSSHVSYSA